MRKSGILFLIFTSFFLSSLGQEKHIRGISLRATTSVSGGDYFIDIIDKGNNFRIIYKFKDSVSKNVNEDPAIIESRRLLNSVEDFRPNNDTVKSWALKLDSLHIAYTHYTIDSISINFGDEPSYVDLFTKVLASSIKELEDNNRNRVVLDGTRIKLIINTMGETKTVYANSPSTDNNPLLYSFINETLNLYRERKENSFLTKQRTDGY